MQERNTKLPNHKTVGMSNLKRNKSTSQHITKSFATTNERRFSILLESRTLKSEAIRSYETLVMIYKTA